MAMSYRRSLFPGGLPKSRGPLISHVLCNANRALDATRKEDCADASTEYEVRSTYVHTKHAAATTVLYFVLRTWSG